MVVEMSTRGQDVVRFHPESLCTESTISISLAGGSTEFLLSSYGKQIDPGTVKSAWYRKPMPLRLPASMHGPERSFAAQEMDQLTRSLFDRLACYWISPPDAMRTASLKPLQLALARELGMEVPRSLLSNDPAVISKFICSAPARVIFKTLQSPIVADDAACFTTVLDASSLDSLESVRLSGGIFQDYVEKKLELRVIVIGDEVIAFEIHSQDREESRIDWRQVPPIEMVHRVHCLPVEIEEQIRKFVAAFGLEFSAMDLILTPDNRYVFLENNPGGQFGWLETSTGVPLTAKLADRLIASGVNRTSRRFWA